MTIVHVLLFWEERCETDPIMVCGMRLQIADDGEVSPKNHDFIGDFGLLKPGQAEKVTCRECRRATATDKQRKALATG